MRKTDVEKIHENNVVVLLEMVQEKGKRQKVDTKDLTQCSGSGSVGLVNSVNSGCESGSVCTDPDPEPSINKQKNYEKL